MSRLNLEPLMTFSDGSYLAISTECLQKGHFSCSVYSVVEMGECTTFRIIVNPLLSAATCLNAQEQAYSCALRIYPGAAAVMKKPPYLVWHGPHSSGVQ